MALFSSRKRPHTAFGDDRWQELLGAVLRAGEVAASAIALPDALQRMLQDAVQLFHAEQGSVMLMEESGQSLELVAASGLPAGVAVGDRMPVGDSVAGRVIATGKPLLLGDVDADAFVNFIPKARTISSSIVVPLRARGRAIGVLSLALGRQSGRFAEADLRIAQMFADQAGVLIHITRLHERAEQRSADLLALTESSKGLIGRLEIEPLLQQVLNGACRLMASGEGFAYLFDAESATLPSGVFRGMDRSAVEDLLGEPEVRQAVADVGVKVLEKRDLVAVGFVSARGTKGVLVVAVQPALLRERVHLLRAFVQEAGFALGTAELHALLQRRETELSAIAHSVPNPIILADWRGRLVTANNAAEELFNLSSQFLSGLPVEGHIGSREIERLLLSEGMAQSEVVVGNPPRSYKVRVSDVSAPGTLVGRVLIMDDVSSEREIAQSQRDFVAMLGHELRTPLTIIKGFAGTMVRRIDRVSRKEASDAFSVIDAKAGQLGRLIEDLLYVSKIESREASLHIEKVDMRTLVTSVVEDEASRHPGREVLVDVPPSLTWQCDEAKIGLVLRHLVENALKYSRPPEPVRIKLAEEGEELRVDVIDRGVGLVSTDVATIFDRFRQVDSSSTREHGGTGVGLYLCAQLVRMHNGRMEVDSTWGKGSTFSFVLPSQAAPRTILQFRGQNESETG